MKPAGETITQRPKRRSRYKALLIGLLVVPALLGAPWLWRQIQFTRLRVPLLKAVKAGDTAQIRTLLDQGADPDVRMDFDKEPFTVATLLRIPPARHSESPSLAMTALMHAARANRQDIVRLLLEHGAEVNRSQQDHHSITALHYAAKAGATACLKELLAHGAAVNAEAEYSSPLHEATRTLELESMRILLDAGADPELQDCWVQTPLRVAVEHALKTAKRPPLKPEERKRYLAVLQLLLDHGADVNRKDNDEVTVRQAAASLHDQEVMRLFHRYNSRVPKANKMIGR